MPANRHEYFIAPRSQLAYLEVPKCACTSFKLLVAKLADVQVAKSFEIHTHFPPELIQHAVEVQSGFLRFTFVRNPFERFMSFYRDKVLDSEDPFIKEDLARSGIHSGMTVDDVLAAVMDRDDAELEKHVRPQACFLLSADGHLTVDFIGRMERMATDWGRLRALTGVGPHLTHENPLVTSQPVPISERTYRAVLAFCRPDFRLLGYEELSFAAALNRYSYLEPR